MHIFCKRLHFNETVKLELNQKLQKNFTCQFCVNPIIILVTLIKNGG